MFDPNCDAPLDFFDVLPREVCEFVPDVPAPEGDGLLTPCLGVLNAKTCAKLEPLTPIHINVNATAEEVSY
jgi:hypothetical protein